MEVVWLVEEGGVRVNFVYDNLSVLFGASGVVRGVGNTTKEGAAEVGCARDTFEFFVVVKTCREIGVAIGGVYPS